MAEQGVKAGVIAGVKAAEARGQELGKLLELVNAGTCFSN